MIFQKEITLRGFARGFHLITRLIEDNIEEMPEKGLLNILVKHTMPDIDPAERMKRWREMEGRTTWFDVNKAKEYGLIDDIR